MAQAGSTGTVTVVDGGGPPPPPAGARDVARAAARAQMTDALAQELSGLEGDAPAEAPPAEAAPAPTDPEKPADEPTDDDDPEEETDPAAEEPKPPEPAPDKDLQKRLAAIQREEKRAKAALAAERQQFAEERRAAEADRRAAAQERAQLQKVMERARYDLPSLLRALGYKEEEFDAAARQVYSESPEGRTDPSRREAAARTARERERDDELQQTRRELAEVKSMLEQRDIQARTEAWIDQAAKAASDETPLVQTMLSRAPAKARQRIAQTAQRLLDETGEVPDHADVLAELEKDRRAELEELGVDVPAAPKAAPPKTNPVQPAAKTKPATRTDLRSSGVQQPGPTPTKGFHERRQDAANELARDFQAGRFDA